MFKSSSLNKIIFALAIILVVNYLVSIESVSGAKTNKRNTTTTTHRHTTRYTTKRIKRTTAGHKLSRRGTYCYVCNQQLLNPSLTFINNVRHFRNTCQKVSKRFKNRCKHGENCYVAKFGVFYVRGCISRRACQQYKKTKNIKNLKLANFKHFTPDTFTCCKGKLCNKKKLKFKNSSTKTASTGILLNVVVLVMANSIVKIFS